MNSIYLIEAIIEAEIELIKENIKKYCYFFTMT